MVADIESSGFLWFVRAVTRLGRHCTQGKVARILNLASRGRHYTPGLEKRAEFWGGRNELSL